VIFICRRGENKTLMGRTNSTKFLDKQKIGINQFDEGDVVGFHGLTRTR
jgi:hypothetical protein